MELKEMIQKLKEHGQTQQKIAEAVTASGTPCSQSMISRIAGGTDPSYKVGIAIRELYVDHFEREKEAA